MLNAIYIGSFVDFKNTIDDCLDSLDKKHLKKMKFLITPNFLIFNYVPVLGEDSTLSESMTTSTFFGVSCYHINAVLV